MHKLHVCTIEMSSRVVATIGVLPNCAPFSGYTRVDTATLAFIEQFTPRMVKLIAPAITPRNSTSCARPFCEGASVGLGTRLAVPCVFVATATVVSDSTA